VVQPGPAEFQVAVDGHPEHAQQPGRFVFGAAQEIAQLDYPVTITLGTLSAANYFTLVNGTLTIGAFTACDVREKGRTDLADIRVLIHEALRVLAPLDFLHDGGVIAVIDVQIVVNAALGLGCSRT
jgi:hypothetical protein